MAILKIKNENGVFINIPSIKGDKGEKGDVGPQGPKGEAPDMANYPTKDEVQTIINSSYVVIEGDYPETNPYYFDLKKYKDGTIFEFKQTTFLTVTEVVEECGSIPSGIYMLGNADIDLDTGDYFCFSKIGGSTEDIDLDSPYMFGVYRVANVGENATAVYPADAFPVRYVVTENKKAYLDYAPNVMEAPKDQYDLTNKKYVDETTNAAKEELQKTVEENKLTAGDGIEITEDNVISSLGIKRITIEGEYTKENPYFLDTESFNDGDLIFFPNVTYVTVKEGCKGTSIHIGFYMYKTSSGVGGNPACYLILLDNSEYIRTYRLRISGNEAWTDMTQLTVKNIVEKDKTNIFTVIPKTNETPTEDSHFTNKLYVDTQIANALGTIETELEEI